MKWKKRIVLGLAMLFSSKSAWAATTATAAAVTASQMGRDPIPWLIGAGAVTVVYAYFRPADKAKAVANGVISVFLGGVGAPLLGAWLVSQELVAHTPINDWFLAGILGAGWPWLVPIALDFIKRRSDGGARNEQ